MSVLGCRPSIRFVVVFVAGLLGAATCLAADWPQWLGPHRNGTSAEAVETWSGELKPLWKASVGNAFSSPIVSNGLVYVHTAVPDKDEEQVTAYYASNGEIAWKDVYPRAVYRSVLGVGPRTTPSVVDGKLITFGITGVLSCYDAKTGKRHWQINPYEMLKAPSPRYGVCSSPIVCEGMLVALIGGEGSTAVAFDIETGELKWKKFEEPVGSASPIVATYESENGPKSEVIIQTTLRMIGLEPKTGEVRWEQPLVFHPQGVSPTPLKIEQRLICSTQENGSLAISVPGKVGEETKVDWWNHGNSSYFSSGAPGPEKTVFLLTNQIMPLPRTDVCCIDVGTGEELWRKNGLGYFHIGLIATANNRLLMLDDGGNLRLAEVSRKEYRELAKTKVCGGTLMNPALADGVVYLRDSAELMAYRLKAAPAGEEKAAAPDTNSAEKQP